MITRTIGSLAAVAIGFLMSTADAAAPQSKQQAPGWYRWMLGTVEITALSDGTFDLDTDAMLTNTAGVPVARLLASAYDGTSIPVSVNAYLINTGRRLLLVDAGAAQRFGPTLGRLSANLRASGYSPAQIDDILVTHLHPDHIGGLVVDGVRAFPNATVHVERREAAFWLSDAARTAASDDRKGFFDTATASMKPYIDAGAFAPFDGPADPVEGVRAMPAPGHTTGHTVYSIESQGQKLVFWGDLMEIASIQLVAPQVTWSSIRIPSPPRACVRRLTPTRRAGATGSPSRICRSRASATCGRTVTAMPGCP